MRRRRTAHREEYDGVKETEQGLALSLWVWTLDTVAASAAVALELPLPFADASPMA